MIRLNKEAREEKVLQAEKVISIARLFTVIAVIVAYVPFIRSWPGTKVWLADTIVTAAAIYALILVFLKPYRKIPILSFSLFATLSDALFITVGIYATDGYYSPFFVAYYGAVFAAAYRYGFWETLISSFVFSASYFGVLLVSGDLGTDPGSIILRIGFTPIVGFLGASFAKEALGQTEETVRQRNLAKQLELEVRERQRIQKELERSNTDLQEFAYVVSHDLQSPLTTMVSFARLLEKRYRRQIDARADEFIDFIIEGGERMAKMINDLLTYSRVGTQTRPFELVDMEGAINVALSQLEAEIIESQANITHDPLPSVRGDYLQMARLFQNLIGNAIKFRSEAAPRVQISVKQENKEWLFGVKDNGIGMDPKFTEQVFGVFQRLHRQAEYPGTGIGLTICKRIVERHGGRIWVESALSEGSTFYFTIPAIEEAA